jgi:hypothetical protein
MAKNGRHIEVECLSGETDEVSNSTNKSTLGKLKTS